MAKEEVFLCTEFVTIHPIHTTSVSKQHRGSHGWEQWYKMVGTAVYKTLFITGMESQCGQTVTTSTCPRMEAWS